MKIGIDWFKEGYEMYKQGKSRPIYDGLALTSWIIDGWEQAAKENREPGYECNCVSFDCPYHRVTL